MSSGTKEKAQTLWSMKKYALMPSFIYPFAFFPYADLYLGSSWLTHTREEVYRGLHSAAYLCLPTRVSDI